MKPQSEMGSTKRKGHLGVTIVPYFRVRGCLGVAFWVGQRCVA